MNEIPAVCTGPEKLDRYANVDSVAVEIADGAMVLTLNRPDDLNALTPAVLVNMADILDAAAADPGVRVLVLRGAGRGFCAGADVSGTEIPGGASPDAHLTPAEVMAAVTRIIEGLTNFPRPVVAAVQGPAVGLGASIALACDVIVAAQSAYFLMAFTKIGLMPDGGASILVPASVGRARAMKMMLLAERVSAAEACAWGMISSVLPDDSLEDEIRRLVSHLGARSTQALNKTKEAVNKATLAELGRGLDLEGRGQGELLRSTEFSATVADFRRR